MIPRSPRPVIPPLPPVALSRVLLVEGDTPLHFFEALLVNLGLSGSIEVRKFTGIATLKPMLTDLAATAEFQSNVTSLGIVRDAENDATAARQSVEYAVQAAGIDSTKVRTSIFILPNNASPGMIETLCMSAVDGEPTLAAASSCTVQFFTCLATNGVALPAEPKLSKHRAQAFLATRDDVQLFPGQAAYRGHWPWDNAAFGALKQFLQSL
jgi:hypothetical protein